MLHKATSWGRVLLIACAVSAAPPGLSPEADGDSTYELPPDSTRAETCRELVERVKQSDCAKPVARYLDGATVWLGFGLHSSQMTLKRSDTIVAQLDGLLSPAPYYGVSLPRRYFGSTGLGWEVSLMYSSSIAIYQIITRGKQTRTSDLGTYAAVTLGSVAPSLFFAYGARDGDPHTHARIGLGLGLGIASIRGTAYFTEGAQDDGSTACHDAATRFAADSLDKAGLKAACAPRTFGRVDVGGGTRIFLDGRWRFIYGAIDVNALRLRGSALDLEPVEVALKLAYIHDL